MKGGGKAKGVANLASTSSNGQGDWTRPEISTITDGEWFHANHATAAAHDHDTGEVSLFPPGWDLTIRDCGDSSKERESKTLVS